MNTKLIPFDIEKAKAGAKVVYHDNEPVEIVTLNGRGDYPVVGYIGEGMDIHTWTELGGEITSIGHLPVIYLSIPTFPEPPEGEAYHNPDNLTPEQVGEGYRLLLKSEIKERELCNFIELYNNNKWLNNDGDGWGGGLKECTYRLPTSIPFHWDAPKEPTYTPFTYETIQPHLGKAVKSKDGTFHAIIAYCAEFHVAVGLSIKYEELLERYTFLDGTPCGTLTEP